jgi:hypothetical protein
VNDLTTVGLKKFIVKSLVSLLSDKCVFASSLVFFCPSLLSRCSHIIRMFYFLITRVYFIGYLYAHTYLQKHVKLTSMILIIFASDVIVSLRVKTNVTRSLSSFRCVASAIDSNTKTSSSPSSSSKSSER